MTYDRLCEFRLTYVRFRELNLTYERLRELSLPPECQEIAADCQHQVGEKRGAGHRGDRAIMGHLWGQSNHILSGLI